MLSLAEKLMHTTLRIETSLKSGGISTGTGFLFTFRKSDNEHIPVIVTNKHVIENSNYGTFVLTKKNQDGSPNIGSYETIKLDNFESLWIKHPDNNVDIAIFPIAPLMRYAESNNLNLYINPLEDSLIPSQQALSKLGGIEDITMIGYPNGIWDSKNNMPIVRKGITATNPKLDWNGMPVFVIDCACFPGSSGSPVLIFNQGGYMDARGNLIMGGGRILLMGVLYAGPQHTAEGEIKIINTPFANVPIALSKIPNNLGFVIKSEKLKDFLKLIK